jgi:hypothetical protein
VRTLFHFVSLFAVVASFLSLPFDCKATDINDILKQRRLRDEFLSSFSVRYQTTGGSGLSGEIITGTDRFSFDCIGKQFRLERIAHSGQRSLAVFNEKDLIVLRTALPKSSNTNLPTYATAVVTRDLSFVPWTVPVKAFVDGFSDDQKFSVWLSDSSIVEESADTIKLVGSVTGSPTGLQTFSEVLLDKSIGYPLKQRISHVRFNSSDKWRQNAKIEVTSFTSKSGFSIPNKGEYVLYFYDNIESTGLVASKFSVEVNEWQIPCKASEKDFDVDIPEGVNVDDKVNGIGYISKRITNLEVEDALSGVVPLRAPSRVSSFIVVMVLLTLLVAVGSFLTRRFFRA